MKNFSFQNVLAALMLVIVLAASLPHRKLLLEQIREEATNMHNNTHGVKSIKWPKHSCPNKVCWAEVFCWAEKALEETPKLKDSDLTRLLRAYNRNNTKVAGCHLGGNHKIDIHCFLDIVVNCTKVPNR